jgi:hypothetical protein
MPVPRSQNRQADRCRPAVGLAGHVHDAAYALRNQIEGDRGRPTSRIEGWFSFARFWPGVGEIV